MRRDLAWCKLTVEEIASLGGSRDRREQPHLEGIIGEQETPPILMGHAQGELLLGRRLQLAPQLRSQTTGSKGIKNEKTILANECNA
jgi:hypothetical protein